MTSTQHKPPNPLTILGRFYNSSIGMKFVMAATGIVMWGFVLGHMAGNLQIFIPGPNPGPVVISEYWGQAINQYAHTLKTTPPLLWGTRIVLLLSVIAHVVTGIRLAALNRAARPAGYRGRPESKWSLLWSKTMPITGIVVLAYIVFHILHFTVPAVAPASFAGFGEANFDQAGLPDVFKMVKVAFAQPAFVAIYVVCNALLIAHLLHGSQSLWQSIGLNHRYWTPLFRMAGWLLVLAILAGNIGIPLGVYSWSMAQPLP